MKRLKTYKFCTLSPNAKLYTDPDNFNSNSNRIIFLITIFNSQEDYHSNKNNNSELRI
jgi:hypothetical protein